MKKNISIRRSQLCAGASTAILATAMLSAPAQAQSIITNPALESVLQAHVAAGNTTPQRNESQVLANNTDFDALTTNTGVTTSGVFENNENTADATAIANRNGVTASLATIGSSTLLDDGIALSAVSVNTGAADANNIDAQIGTTATDFATGSVDVSRNTASATVVVNEGSDTYAMSITGSEPVGYANLATTNAEVTADLSGSAASVADLSGTLLVSSVQVADGSSDSSAVTVIGTTNLTLQTNVDADVTGTATLDGNAFTSAFTANARDASIALAADDSNTSATAAISIAQSFDANDSDISASTSDNTVRADISSVLDDGTTTSFVNSSLSVAANTLSATANGNTADSQITLADGLAYNTDAGNTASATIDELDATSANLADIAASAGLVGVSTQLVTTGGLEANLSSSGVDVDVASPESSAIDVSGNRITAAATGNNLTAGIDSGASSAVFDASAALASRQELDGVAVVASASNADILVNAGSNGADATFVDSTITVDGNVEAASATGNRARQSITLEATALNASDDTSATLSADLVPTAGGASVSATGAVVIASAMINTDSTVSASNSASDIDITTGDTLSGSATNTTVAVTNNAQQAFAVGSDAGNSLSLTGVDVGSAVGISNLQTNDGTSTVSANQDASIDVDYLANLISGTAEISGNTQSAIARGTVAANTLAVDAQVVTLGASGTATSTPGSQETAVTAAFGVSNVQQVLADVTASIGPDDTNAFRMDVAGGLTDANTTVNANTLMAQAQGTVAANALTLEVGSLTSADSAGDAAIANLQTVSGADILATANGNANNAIETEIDLAVTRSSVETSNNRIMASAESARASNVLTVSGTSLSGTSLNGVADSYPDSPEGDTNIVTAQFGVANTQVSGLGNVTASLRETTGGAFTDSSAVVTDLNSTVSSSTIESNGNLLQALASSNRATNAVNVDGNTLTSVTSGVSNSQVSSQDVSALVGFAGSAPIEPFSVSTTITANIGSGTLAGLTPDQRAAFLSQYSASLLSYDNVTFAFTYSALGTGASSIAVLGTNGSFNAGGVLMDIEGTISSSTVAIEGNAVQGSAIGNTASNSVNVSATSVDGVDAVALADVWTQVTGDPEAKSDGDAALASTQMLLAGSSSTTEVYTTFAIDGALDTAITDSNLSVSGNSAYGEAIGNTITNSLTVAGTDLAGTATSGVLSNTQDGSSAAISAVSDMEVASNVVSSGSTIALDRNVNNALGVVNNATNTLAASSTNSTSSDQSVVTSEVADGVRIDGQGSFVLANGQSASGTLTTSAVTSVYNIGSADTSTTGVVNGNVSMSDNVTRSESTANRAANTVSVGADANLGSTAALINQQASSATTTANATSTVRMGVSGTDPLESLDTSSVSIEGNSTLALARGNSASNTLNYTAGANYTAQAAAASISGLTSLAQADAALLNDQINSGAVTANATGVTSVALNAAGLGTTAGVLNGTVSNSNNSTTAFAVGNTAANTVTLASLNTGMPNVALGSQQTNSGAVTANVTAVTYSVGSFGTFGASSVQNSGNAASATAIGNSSVSVIGAN